MDLNREERRQLPAVPKAKQGPATRNEDAKSSKRQALESAGLAWKERKPALIVGLGLTVPLGFSGPLKLIFAAH